MASAPRSNATSTQPALDMQAKIEFLKEDLSHLFDDRGIDPSAYEEVVDFKDPITKYDSLSGYLFNIKFLRKAFNPVFILHDIRQTADCDITTRWTMEMEFSALKSTPLAKYWSPNLVFTGTSTYVFRPETGKIYRHIDTWDSVQNQQFFSVEAFADFFKQLLQFQRTPSLETPAYTILKRTAGYQIRRYEPFLVAQAPLDVAAAIARNAGGSTAASTSGAAVTDGAAASISAASGRPQFDPAGPGMNAFNALAGYIFGGNRSGERMQMTTPVLSSTDGTMQFVIGPSARKTVDTLPSPLVPGTVTGVQQPGGVYAAVTFSGQADGPAARRQAEALAAALRADSVAFGEGNWTLARYNDPSMPGPFRRNEVLIRLPEYQLPLM